MRWIVSGRYALYPVDTHLVNLELQCTSSSAPGSYGVRIKAWLSMHDYTPQTRLYPLRYRGKEMDITAQAYILLPGLAVTIVPVEDVDVCGIVREVIRSDPGLDHVVVADMRALYFCQDRALAIWQVDVSEAVDNDNLITLWTAFEQWLLARFPHAVQMFCDDAEPGNERGNNRIFLQLLGYTCGGDGICSKRLEPHKKSTILSSQ